MRLATRTVVIATTNGATVTSALTPATDWAPTLAAANGMKWILDPAAPRLVNNAQATSIRPGATNVKTVV